MFKNKMFFIVVALSCTTAYGSTDGQSVPLNVNQHNKTSENNRYSVGSIILINTIAIAATYVTLSLIGSTLSPEKQQQVMYHVASVAAITTTGCIIVEGMNCIEHVCNPSKHKDSDLKKSLNLNQSK